MNHPPSGNGVGSSTAGLPPPRFGLVALFWLVGLVAVSLVVWKAVGPGLGLTLLLLFAILGAHVAGNAIGTRLRERGTQHAVAAWQDKPAGVRDDFPSRASRRQVQPEEFAPVTRLSHRASLGWFPLLVTLLGGASGTVGGGMLLQRMYPATATPATLLLGSLATGVLGALFSFWLCSLLQVIAGAWWQAHRQGHHR